jgi:cytochrome d ubiquinol oxidase subunit II
MSLEVIMAGIILIALTFYVLMGGADYGAGVWTLFARGARGRVQQRVIEAAIGPIWEANHVWLIMVVTLLFTAFPSAFAAIAIWLHIPLTLMLLGIVFRGAAFAFRNYDVKADPMHFKWGQLFAIASAGTPVLLGIIIGALASGRVGHSRGGFLENFVWPWLAAFPIAVGIFALTQFALLAAVYLLLEAENAEVQEAFRRRAVFAWSGVVVMATVVLIMSKRGAPMIREALARSAGGWVVLVFAGTLALAVAYFLWIRRYSAARWCAIGEVTIILWGWALAQFPYLVVPDVTIYDAAASSLTLQLLLVAIVLGAALLFPSLYFLFRVFKSGTALGTKEDSDISEAAKG